MKTSEKLRNIAKGVITRQLTLTETHTAFTRLTREDKEIGACLQKAAWDPNQPIRGYFNSANIRHYLPLLCDRAADIKDGKAVAELTTQEDVGKALDAVRRKYRI